jgi:hypothetical protein
MDLEKFWKYFKTTTDYLKLNLISFLSKKRENQLQVWRQRQLYLFKMQKWDRGLKEKKHMLV